MRRVDGLLLYVHSIMRNTYLSKTSMVDKHFDVVLPEECGRFGWIEGEVSTRVGKRRDGVLRQHVVSQGRPPNCSSSPWISSSDGTLQVPAIDLTPEDSSTSSPKTSSRINPV